MKTYPANLLLENRKCLVVGGGKVAARKLDRLVESGADVKVVAAKASNKIKDLAEFEKLELLERNFEENDLENIFLAFAATDDRELNSKIFALAEKRGILCCVVDRNWKNGSFITPASVSRKEITVAVSSQGVDCRRSRLIKENLARHIDSIENSGLLVIGSDHNLMNMKQREQIQITGDELEKTGDMIRNLWGIQEFMLLNTCNRTELIAAASHSESLVEILKMILKLNKFSADKYYVKTGYEAFRHLCLAASGLLSQTPGENHISAQFKQSFAQAEKYDWAGTLLDSLKNSVLYVSREIRSESKSIFKGVEIEELVCQILKEKFSDVSGKKIIIAGTGLAGRAAKDILSKERCCIDWLYHSRKPENSDENVSLGTLSELSLVNADVVISALSSAEPFFSVDMADDFKSGAEIIDLGMPRNVSPELAKARKDVNITSMEDIKHWYRKHHRTMKSILKSAECVMEKHKDEYEKFSNSFTGRRAQQ